MISSWIPKVNSGPGTTAVNWQKNGIFVTVGGDLPQLAALLIFKGVDQKIEPKRIKDTGIKSESWAGRFC